MNEFSLMQADGVPVLRASLADSNGAINLSGSNCYFIYRGKYVDDPPVSGLADIISATSGIVEYAWTPEDTVNQGVFYGFWRVSGSNNLWSSFPNDSYSRFVINPVL